MSYARAVRTAAILFTIALAFGCDKGGSTPPAEGGGVRVVAATYGPHSNASAEAQKKCEFDDELTQAVAATAAGVKDGEGKILTMSITRMRGAEPAWEGEISVIVEGELDAHGETIGSFRLQRRALGGVGGGMAGVCKGLDDIAEHMAEDIAAWLAHPKKDSELGG